MDAATAATDQDHGEELENGMMRAHIAENLARQNRQHEDYRCDGDFDPRVNAKGDPTGTSTSCRLVDANTVMSRLRREADDGWVEGEGISAVSPDGSRLTTTFERRDRAGNIVETVERRFTRNAENCLNHERDELFRECQQRTSPPRQPRDPRIGEWRQDRDSPTPQGLTTSSDRELPRRFRPTARANARPTGGAIPGPVLRVGMPKRRACRGRPLGALRARSEQPSDRRA